MSVSEKQLRANRANAQKSSGPKSKRGKKHSSRNATKYGLFSRDLIINSAYHKENKTEFKLLLHSLISDLNPTTALQDLLVQKIAAALWRARRAAAAETARINEQLNRLGSEMSLELESYDIFHDQDDENYSPPEYDNRNSKDYLNLVNSNLLPDHYYATRILYYEMRLDRQLTRYFNLLQKLQMKKSADKIEDEKTKFEKTNPLSHSETTA